MNEGRIEKLIMGGDGLLKDISGKVTFIPYVLPSELVSYDIVEEKKDFNKAHIREILEAHPLRIAPKCPHFTTCEGCQLQQAPIELQREMKRSWLLEQFKRVCKQTPPGLESMEALESWQYRRVVDWHWEKSELGYRNAQGALVPITTCEIVQGGQKSLLKAKKLMQALNIESAKLRWIQSSERTLAVIEIPSLEKAPLIIEKLSNFWPESELDGLHLVHKHEGLCYLGHQEIAENIEGLSIKWHVQGFLQNHLQGSLSFYRWLETRMERSESESRSVWLDLYCGTGVTALMAARQGWNVFGYEISAPAIKMARKNAKVNKWDATCHFDVRDLNRPLDKLVPEPKKLGGILVNPPRTGLSRPIIEYINASACQKILYLSCDPATLCRDLHLFLENGFQLKDWKAFDCFAQTSHFETAAMLIRN